MGPTLIKMTLQEKIQAHLADAMKSKDQLRLSVLRMMKTAVKNKEIDKMKPLDDGTRNRLCMDCWNRGCGRLWGG